MADSSTTDAPQESKKEEPKDPESAETSQASKIGGKKKGKKNKNKKKKRTAHFKKRGHPAWKIVSIVSGLLAFAFLIASMVLAVLMVMKV
ncbi:unnamed protein product [Caenorhabditis auriculariae]|uniref:Uncharacterized protein n=1 Tax=Caenorhabditis auriculariae TaxID=2777116 RepID=A0A8S1HV27_9PELO|nr:unnamed protein product [Caenorhabditis auriculariae]